MMQTPAMPNTCIFHTHITCASNTQLITICYVYTSENNIPGTASHVAVLSTSVSIFRLQCDEWTGCNLHELIIWMDNQECSFLFFLVAPDVK